MELYDTHAHLADEHLAADVTGVLERAKQARVTRILAVGITAESSASCQQIAANFPQVVRSSAGFIRIMQRKRNPAIGSKSKPSPNYPKLSPSAKRVSISTGKIARCRCSRITSIGTSVCHSKRVCHSSFTSAKRPTKSWQMLREARQRGELRGVMHSFTGTAAEAVEFVALGLHISFAGMVTFKKSDDLRAVAATIPGERLLVETILLTLRRIPFAGSGRMNHGLWYTPPNAWQKFAPRHLMN